MDTVQQALDYSLQQQHEQYERERKARNAAYLAKIDRGMKQIAEGRGTVRDLIEDDNV